jgi:hypothetical protein
MECKQWIVILVVASFAMHLDRQSLAICTFDHRESPVSVANKSSVKSFEQEKHTYTQVST